MNEARHHRISAKLRRQHIAYKICIFGAKAFTRTSRVRFHQGKERLVRSRIGEGKETHVLHPNTKYGVRVCNTRQMYLPALLQVIVFFTYLVVLCTCLAFCRVLHCHPSSTSPTLHRFHQVRLMFFDFPEFSILPFLSNYFNYYYFAKTSGFVRTI